MLIINCAMRRDQTTSESQVELSRAPSSTANDCGIRSDAYEPQGAGVWVSDDDVRKQSQRIDQLFDLAVCDLAV
jgi:hypothetical protein